MIANETANPGANEFWSICLNFHQTSVGGCQQIVRPGDQVLFAFANSAGNNRTTTYLRLYGPTGTTAPVGNVTLTVTDGNGAPVTGATINQFTPATDAFGKVTISFAAGTYKLKAHKNDNLVSIRSNEFVLVVQ
jgi:hypothetical protein